MAPFLDLGGFPLSTYAVMAVVGYLVAVSVAVRLGRPRGYAAKTLVDLTFWLLVATIVGARLGFLVEQLPTYLDLCVGADAPHPDGCGDFFLPWRGGFVFYGGALLAGGTLWFLARRAGHAPLALADTILPGVALGHAFGRVGCLLAGCCYGKETTLPWAVAFPDVVPAGGVLRHPTALYEALAEALIALVLWRLLLRRGRDGRVLLGYIGLYGAARFVIELFRGDADRGFVFEVTLPEWARALGVPPHEPLFLSWAQALSLLAMAVALVWAVAAAAGRRRGKEAP